MNEAPDDRENEAVDESSFDTDEEDHREEVRGGGTSFIGDLLRFSLLSIIIVVPIRLFIASPFVVNGSSMDPTFHTGEYLIVDQLSYQFSEPERGDVVIFHFPQNPSQFFIKRVIGLPGETVVLEGNKVKIINTEHPNGFYLDQSFLTHKSPKEEEEIFKLREDEYVVLGDNRTASSDSRVWGTVDERLIVGRALLRLFPLSTVGYMPGDIDLQDQQQ
ncbi:MAG: signal peptidase I [Candidatus Campbellbacteria bacterium]|nr:signal peptidase I [Candidatus Campbellbacteria bacterium]